MSLTSMRSFFTTLALFSFLHVDAQTTIANGGFENWDNVGAANEEPTDWNSNKSGGGLAPSGPQTCFQSSDAHSGNYSAKIETKYYIIAVVNGNMTTGKVQAPSVQKSEGFLEASDANRMAFTGRPDSLVGWYKYTQATSGSNANAEKGKVIAWLHSGTFYDPPTPVNNNHPDSSANKIAVAEFYTDAADQTTWKRFSVPFDYSSAATPAYIMINITSSADQNTVAPGATGTGSILLLDDMEVVYNPTRIEEVQKEKIAIVQNRHQLKIDLSQQTFRKGNFLLMDLSGKVIADYELKTNQHNQVTLTDVSSGIYFYQLNIEGQKVQSDKLLIQ